MRTLVAVVTTSVLTALAVHVVDARAAGDAVEARQFVVRDDAGIVRATLDRNGLLVVDAAGRERAAVQVEDDGQGASTYGSAQVWVSALGGERGFATVGMTDGVHADVTTGGSVPARLFAPRSTCTEHRLATVDGSQTASTVVSPGRVRFRR